jgi:acid phosphatase
MNRLYLVAARLLLCNLVVLLGVQAAPQVAQARAMTSSAVPQLDHVIVIVLENHSYDEALAAPYMASLVSAGASFSNCHAETHPSQPNYLALWSGSTQGVTNDACPAPGSPFATSNLGAACEDVGLTWMAYSEDIPSPGYTGCSYASMYERKHEPWTYFSNLDHANERSFDEFALAESLGTLPNLAFVIPNQCHNGHDCAMSSSDSWLSLHVPGMLHAVGPHGVVIVTFDEDDHSAGNRILTTFNGDLVSKSFVSSQPVNHYTLLRTICDAIGIEPFGAAIAESPITDIWGPGTVGVQGASWGTVKNLYR